MPEHIVLHPKAYTITRMIYCLVWCVLKRVKPLTDSERATGTHLCVSIYDVRPGDVFIYQQQMNANDAYSHLL